MTYQRFNFFGDSFKIIRDPMVEQLCSILYIETEIRNRPTSSTIQYYSCTRLFGNIVLVDNIGISRPFPFGDTTFDCCSCIVVVYSLPKNVTMTARSYYILHSRRWSAAVIILQGMTGPGGEGNLSPNNDPNVNNIHFDLYPKPAPKSIFAVLSQ